MQIREILNQQKKNRIKWLLAVELLLILAVMTGFLRETSSYEIPGSAFTQSNGENGNTQWDSTALPLHKGVYQVTLNYETKDDQVNACTVSTGDDLYGKIWKDACILYSGENQAKFQFWLFYASPQMKVNVIQAAGSSVSIQNVKVTSTHLGTWMILILLLGIFGLVDACAIRAQEKKERTMEQKQTFLFLTALIIGISFPVLTGYEIAGTDTFFQMLRIVGVKDGLLAGQFPVRIQPGWLQGYGYPISIFYADTFLYIPALLRLAGFPIGMVYLFYKLMINVATVLVAYWCFHRIFENRLTAMLGCALYACTPYRLLCLYQKDALQEATAMIFLPLIFYGFWKLLEKDRESREYRRIWIVFSVGITGLVQSHIFLAEAVLVILVVFFLLFWKKTFHRRTILEILKSLIMSLGLSMWYLIPFAEGCCQLQVKFFGAADPAGVRNTIFNSAGGALFFGTIFVIWFLWNKDDVTLLAQQTGMWDKKEKRLTRLTEVCMLAGLAGCMVSFLRGTSRLPGIAVLFLTVSAMAVYQIVERRNARIAGIYMGVSAVAVVLSAGLLLSQILAQDSFYRVYDEGAIVNSANFSSEEFLPKGTDTTLLKAGAVGSLEGITVSSFSKDNRKITFACENSAHENGFVTVPLLYTKGYQAIETETGEKLGIEDGENHVVKVMIPSEFDGTIQVAFVSPWYWRMGEIITILTLLTGAVWIRKKRRLIGSEVGV